MFEETSTSPSIRLTEDEIDFFVKIRRDLHHHPELAFKEHRTADIIAGHLKDWGYKVYTTIGKTGVVGQLKRGDSGPRLGLRADIDAVPIQEDSGLAWASCNNGVMHACGHDGHTTMLLAAAKYLALHSHFEGTLNLIFQPAEELGEGASRMIEDGLFEIAPCDAVFGLHNMPGIEAGRLVLKEGVAMASSDCLSVKLTGVGGHGSMPHLTSDPVVAASAIVMALQTVVSRNASPLESAVVTVGSLQAGQVANVIPGQASLEINIRALNQDVRDMVNERVKDIISCQAKAFNVDTEINSVGYFPILINSPAETSIAREAALKMLGSELVTEQGPPLMASEDLSFLLEKVPGSYVIIGNGNDKGPCSCMVHNPGYDFNDDIIGTGSSFWINLAELFFKQSKNKGDKL